MTTRGEAPGHVLQGTLGTEDVRALFERCASLRFTGLLELVEGPRRTSVPFVEGEPLDGPDLFKLGAVWRRGNYRLVQRAVDFLGNLTDDVVLSGTLRDTPPMQLFRHCEDGRLSAEINIQTTDGQRARVRFARGRLESAEVNGQPSMAALPTIGAWSAGTFRLVLAPMFDGNAPAPVPAGRAPSGPQSRVGLNVRPVPSDVFDITAKVPLWQVDGEEGGAEAPSGRLPSSSGPPTVPSLRPAAVPGAAAAGPSGGPPPRPGAASPPPVRPSLFASPGKPAAPPSPGPRPSAAPAAPSRNAPSFARPAAPGAGSYAITHPATPSATPAAKETVRSGAAAPPPRGTSSLPSFSAPPRPGAARTTVLHPNPPPPAPPAAPPASGWELPDDEAPPPDAAWGAPPRPAPRAEPLPRLEPAVSLPPPPRFAPSAAAPATIQDINIESLMRHVSEFGEMPVAPTPSAPEPAASSATRTTDVASSLPSWDSMPLGADAAPQSPPVPAAMAPAEPLAPTVPEAVPLAGLDATSSGPTVRSRPPLDLAPVSAPTAPADAPSFEAALPSEAPLLSEAPSELASLSAPSSPHGELPPHDADSLASLFADAPAASTAAATDGEGAHASGTGDGDFGFASHEAASPALTPELLLRTPDALPPAIPSLVEVEDPSGPVRVAPSWTPPPSALTIDGPPAFVPVPEAPPPSVPVAVRQAEPSSPARLQASVAGSLPAVPAVRASSPAMPAAALPSIMVEPPPVSDSPASELADLFPASPLPDEPDVSDAAGAGPAGPPLRAASRGGWLWLGIVGSLGVAAAYAFWPAPPPPAPPPKNIIVTTPVTPPTPTVVAPADPAVGAAPLAANVKPAAAPTTPTTPTTPAAPAPAPGAPVAPTAAAAPTDAFGKLILGARKATIEGNKRLAMKLFAIAYRMDAKNPAFDRYVPMTLGKTGKGQILLEGKGSVLIDGHPFAAPRKLTVAAGPHLVQLGASSGEVVVAKGGTQKIAPASGVVPGATSGAKAPR